MEQEDIADLRSLIKNKVTKKEIKDLMEKVDSLNAQVGGTSRLYIII